MLLDLDPNEEYELCEIAGKKAIFTEERIHESAVPEGLFKYDLREADDPDVFYFATLEQRVVVNHAGTVLVSEQIDLGKKGYIDFVERPDDSPNFIGSDITLKEFMDLVLHN